jgi:oligopeptide/dipeptide ABC transporter ATP-binding protein
VSEAVKGHNGSDKPLVSVRHLKQYFPVRKGVFSRVVAYVKAVDVSFDVAPGETVGLVGESGCGKTTVGRTLLRLIPPTEGDVTFEGADMATMPAEQLEAARQRMQIIFQDPYSSLNPRMTVGAIIGEGLAIHRVGTRRERLDRVRDTMQKCGLDPAYANRYPHEFSGGQRQRIGIARALALEPRFIVCDEPVSALDVSIQSQIINLLAELKEHFGLAYLFIAHDLSVVEYISDRVAVMYLGKIVEFATSEELYRNPLHPYTQALLSAVPVPDPQAKSHRQVLPGDVPSPLNPPAGCRFHPRCPLAKEICSLEEPREFEVAGHKVWCHVVEEELKGQAATEPRP